jgi:hypothetical protein
MTDMNAAGAAPKPTLRLDRSKRFSTVHGDRVPDDPHYKVHFWQDDLPFDVNGILVPDDGKTQDFSGVDTESKPVRYQPLYTEARRKKLEKRLARLTKVARAPEPEELEEEAQANDASPEVKAAMASEVNLESWLRGEVQYEPWMIFEAFKARYHRQTHKLGDVVTELVLDEKIVRPEEVVKYLARYLPADVQTPSQAA